MCLMVELQRDCDYCRKPIRLKWKNGPMPSERVSLIVDPVFHARCWAKLLADSNVTERSWARTVALEPHRSL